MTYLGFDIDVARLDRAHGTRVPPLKPRHGPAANLLYGDTSGRGKRDAMGAERQGVGGRG